MIRLIDRIAQKAKILRCRNFRAIASALQGKNGMEIGGPSPVFMADNLIPIYPLLGSLETSNFSDHTLWSDTDVTCVHEGTSLKSIPDNHYDFVLASHVLEHIANPLKALSEWRRVLKPGGSILTLLPYKKYTFDHRRPYTTFAHLKEDFDLDRKEDDQTHLAEILALHDLDMDLAAGTPAQFKERSSHNFENRALHHHVFDPGMVDEIYSFAGLQLLSQSIEFPFHIVSMGRKAA